MVYGNELCSWSWGMEDDSLLLLLNLCVALGHVIIQKEVRITTTIIIAL